MAILITTGGEKTELVKPNTHEKLTVMQQLVGGLIEVVYGLPEGRVMIVNEEGRLHGLPVNHTASAWADGKILGNVIILDKGEIDDWLN